MPDIIFDIDENYNPMEDLRRAEGKDKKRLAELYREIGYLKPDPNRGIFKEIGHTVMDTNNQLGLSFGRTIEELTGNPNMRERYERKIELDPQYGADEFYSPSSLKPSHVARTVTTGAVQSLGAIGAGMLGTAIAGPAGGVAAAGAVTFGQIYGDTVKEYRDAMPGEDESVVKGLAFTSAVGQSMLETIIGPEKVIAGFGKSFFSGALKETTKSLARRIGAEAAKGAVSEGAEEVLQDFWNRICKGVAAKEGFQPPSWEEVRDQFMGGALPGAVLGGVAGIREARTGTDGNGVVRNGTEIAGPIEGVPPTGTPIPVSEDAIIRGGGQTAAEALYDEIGIKHSRMTPEEQNTEGIGYVMQDGKKRIANGLFDRKTNEIKINPTNEGEMFTHGHELDHWLDQNHPDLARQLHVIMDSELNAAGMAENESPIERRADMLGYLFEDPKTLKRTVEIGEANHAGFGEKFLNAVIEFSKQVMAFMKNHADLPGAEKYFNNYKKVRNTAAQILAEVKSRNKAEQEKIKAETPELEMAPAANAQTDTGSEGGGGSSRTVRTPDGSMEVPARFKVIPIEAAVHSGKEGYDQRFQPRNRDTKSSEAQIQRMSGDIHPEMLLDSPTTDTGAPIVDSKGQVISGNGRVMALLRARGQNIQDYYAAVRKFAAENGIEIPAGLKNPLLVREVGDTDLVKLAELSNRDNKLRRTDAEQAEADAKTIMDSNLLDIFNPNEDGTIITGQNMDFLREFIQRSGDDSLRNSDGSVASGAEQRVRRAVLAAMFDGRKNARTLIQNLIENATEDGLKRQVDGVTAAVGRIMKLTAREGYRGYDLREDLARAFEALLEYKRELQIDRKRYNSIDDYLKQGDMFERNLSPNAELLARFLGNAKSIRQIRDVLNDYADHVERIDIHTDDMFGAKDEGKDSLLKRLLPGEETRTDTDGNGSIRSGTENAETKAETRDQMDADRPAVRSSSSEGRFDQNSETPLLSAEEDAGDFQLFSETPKEAAQRDQAIEKAEAEKLERAKEEARRNAPDLPMEDASAETANTNGENGGNGGNGGKKTTAASQRIEDFGEKIGGARKDLAEKTGPRTTTQKKDDSGEPKWKKNYIVDQLNSGKWAVFHRKQGMMLLAARNMFDTREEAENSLPAVYVADKFRFYTNKDGKVGLYKYVPSSRNAVPLKGGFESREAAMRWALQHVDELEKIRSTYGERDLALKPDYERTGERRLDHDATAKDFSDAFGFRGVEFGNWENQRERQQLMNDAYEALHDLAELLKIPARGISLDGQLGLAFGSRGHGGSARAHYESDYVVINLTKPSGAGSFAHEWFHALDNYFRKQALNSNTPVHEYLSDQTRLPEGSGMRQELFEKFEALKKSIMENDRPPTKAEQTGYRENIESRKKDLKTSIDELRQRLVSAPENQYRKRKIKPATEEQLKKYDEISARLLADDAPRVEWDVSVTRYTNSTLEALGKLHKEITGSSGFTKDGYGQMDKLASEAYWLQRSKERLNKRIHERTSFHDGALELDKYRSDKYWSNPWEMFSRAFSAFIEDKLAAEGRKSEFLSYGSDNNLYNWSTDEANRTRAFPEGEERTRINNAFQDFFDTLKTETTPEGNTRLYSLFDNSRKTKRIFSALQKIADGEEEATISNLRDDLQQYGGTNDVTFCWGNNKKGIYHIASRRGLNVLFHVVDAVADGKVNRFVKGNMTVVLEKDGYEAVLALTEYGNKKSWLLSGWETNKPDAAGGVGTQSGATQSMPTFSRHELGAGLQTIIQQSSANVNPDSEKNPEKSSDDQSGKVFSLRKHQQVNPIVVNGQVRAEYADLLDNKEYTPETISEWDQKAIAWIDRQGGIEPAAEMIANDTEHSDRHVATLVRRHILNSEFAESLPADIRMAVELKNIDEGKAWGREGVARRLAALTLKNIDTVKALFRKLHENMPDKEKIKLRNTILDQTGVDINNLPPDLVNDKSKLDKVLRAELANRSNKFDKAYEYWINAILSAPTTHSANLIGNTANALYELGPKRFAEAAVNALAKRKDAATFGEFREMWNALDFRSAWKKAKIAFDLETLTPGGKFRENATVAIPGKLGRAVRTPGRLLVMADAFARELLIPAETASRAYREAKNLGLTGAQLRSYIQQQMSNPGSTAYQAGKASAERIIFQEDPGAVLQRLIQLKASDGPGAQILKYLLPFVKTPGNILKQGIRKSPLGSLNLAWETVQGLRGKRAFDSEYLGHAAEQLIAWAAFLALGGFGDDDDDARPFLTGSSAPAGSGENKFKANTVPPYSIRIGDTYYSYRRIEPLATGLAVIADAMQAIREVRNGKDTAKALNDMLRKTGKMISEKSYLDSINQAVRFLEDPDRSLATFGTNFIASWVPNGLRAALNAGKDEVEDSKSRERGEEFLKDQLQVITSRMGFTSRTPKLDLFGHPITKEQQEDPDVTDFLWRVLVPVNRTAIDEDHPGKRLLLNYNASHPENQWWGSIPNYRFTRNKERYYFDNEAYHQFAAEAGKLAEKQIFNAVRHGVIHPDNPTEKDIEIMKKIFARARKETRAKFFQKAKKW